MNVSLTPHLETWVQQKVRSGRYNSASEVMREALRTMIEKDQEREAKLAVLRRDIQEGIDSGEPEPLEDIDTLLQMARAAHRKNSVAVTSAIPPTEPTGSQS
jgi:antitoxin ParD1/3/4